MFGAVVAWAGSTIVAAVMTRWAREAIASVVLAAIGATALGLAAGELGLWRSWLPRVSAPAGSSAGGLGPRPWVLALGFGATMAIFSPLPTYALLLGWVAARQSAGLGALTLASYGLGLMIPLAIAGTVAARRDPTAGEAVPAWQERVRIVGGASLAVAGGFLLSMWTLRATWGSVSARRVSPGNLAPRCPGARAFVWASSSPPVLAACAQPGGAPADVGRFTIVGISDWRPSDTFEPPDAPLIRR